MDCVAHGASKSWTRLSDFHCPLGSQLHLPEKRQDVQLNLNFRFNRNSSFIFFLKTINGFDESLLLRALSLIVVDVASL